MPSNRRTPIVADDDAFVIAQRLDDTDHIAGKMKQCVLINRIGFVGLAIAAHIRRDRAVSRFCERLKLVSP